MDFFKGIIVDPVVEQVIDVPKIPLPSLAPTRFLPRAPLTAEKLVDVPAPPRRRSSIDCCQFMLGSISSTIVG